MNTINPLKYLGFICLSLVHFVVMGQEEESIEWTSDAKLTWRDFKGKPTNTRAAAITASGISYRFSTISNGKEIELDFEVSTFFYPNQSWYQPSLCDEVILGHEQLHFDISELFARKMRKQLQTTRFTKNVKAEVKAIYRKINKELSDFQNRYDDETNYSRNLEAQLEWNEEIAKTLGRN